MLQQRVLMIQKLLLNIGTIWLIFIKKLKIIIQMQNVKVWLVFDDMNMIGDLISNKELNAIVTELLIRGRKLNITLFYYTILFFCVKRYLKKNARTILSWNSK